jgi:3-deoxy-7-phosphoheptulonate synthase
MPNQVRSVWTPATWRKNPTKQIPIYADESALDTVERRLASTAPLVTPGEIRRLREHLAGAARGEAFVIQGGDCAETFEATSSEVLQGTVRTLQQMAFLISMATCQHVVTIGRIAGQFAKPRSSSTETRMGRSLPSYQGDIINGREFTEQNREADPERMLQAYRHAAATLGFARTIAGDWSGGMDRQLQQVRSACSHLLALRHVQQALHRVRVTIALLEHVSRLQKPAASADLYTSHEALLLPYEQQLTRQDPEDGRWYNCSAHTVWVGDRTRQIDGGHVEYVRGIENHIGVKCGPTMPPDELCRLLDVINPENAAGKVSLIVRVGADRIESALQDLVKSVARRGHQVIWMTDPMHGNTRQIEGVKTRAFDDITREASAFIKILGSEGVHVGGLHLELTGDDVTECVGGTQGVPIDALRDRYTSACDPRLNARQALEFAFSIVEELMRHDWPGTHLNEMTPALIPAE